MADTTPLDVVRDRIAKAAAIAGRPQGDVTLIAVSKTRGADEIRPLLEAGHRDFGESRVQEAQEKWPELKADFPGARLHMIGRLQSNKAADAAALFDVIHSLDRGSLLKELAKAEPKREVFVQVDIGEEEQKGGIAAAKLPEFLERVRRAGLPLNGLMCIPPQGLEAAPFFALLAELARRNGLDGLSMGMSDDYESAVKLGATHVRVGTALFGKRPA